MNVPPLGELLRWMSNMPAAFRAEPEGFPGGQIRVRAVVADLFETCLGAAPGDETLAAFTPANAGTEERNRLRWILAAVHLLWHPIFRAGPPPRAGLERLLIQDIASVAGIVSRDQLETDEERREELIRLTLRALAMELPEETSNEAEDRFKQVDSCERRRVLLAASERERRSREVREAMAKKAAQEAAAKVSRE
jgi:hypothetical protein